MGASLFDQVWTSAFEQFWQAYPRKVGKLAARREFEKAMKRTGATLDQLLEGLERYRTGGKPDYADWCHPRTWLSQGRWMDEADTPRPAPEREDWYEECQRIHAGACQLSQYAHHIRKQLEQGWKDNDERAKRGK